MKLGTLHLPEMRHFERKLKKPPYAAIGVPNGVRHLAAEAADEGNIRKFTNEEIADYIGWYSEPDELIRDLLETRWLDVSKVHRLVIHDWVEHCPQYIKDRIKKRRQRAANAKNKGLTAIPGGTRTGHTYYRPRP